METVEYVVIGILGSLALFVVVCMCLVCDEEIEAWWKRRKEKDD